MFCARRTLFTDVLPSEDIVVTSIPKSRWARRRGRNSRDLWFVEGNGELHRGNTENGKPWLGLNFPAQLFRGSQWLSQTLTDEESMAQKKASHPFLHPKKTPMNGNLDSPEETGGD
jgi:hypothetical protein